MGKKHKDKDELAKKKKDTYRDTDELTKIHNESYLKRNYEDYVNSNYKSKLILFDFKSFKHFNDTYGHDTGDIYLKLFAKVLKDNFTNSIVVRLHGDEYAVVTNKSIEEIERTFDVCDASIKISFEAGMIPEIFHYNAGITKAESCLSKSIKKADYMMYYAKNNNLRSHEFKKEIWNEKIELDKFIKSINDHTDNREFSYFCQTLFTPKKEKTDIKAISTRTKDDNIIFTPEKYNILRNNSQLKKIDFFNIQYLLLRMDIKENRMMISFDHKSLLAKNDLVKYLKLLVDVMKLDSSKIIITINVNDMEQKNYDKFIKMINEIKSLGFGICIDRYNSKTGDFIYENSQVDYIKFDDRYWKAGMNDPKVDYSIRAKASMFINYINPTIPIFTRIEKESEYLYAKDIVKDSQSLLGGNYFEKSKRMELKRD